MATATIVGPLKTADEKPLANQTVRAYLVAGKSGGHVADGELITEAVTQTDGSGAFSLTLTLGDDIAPAGSHYLVTSGVAKWTIALLALNGVTADSTWAVGDPAIQVDPTVLAPLGASVDFVNAAIFGIQRLVGVPNDHGGIDLTLVGYSPWGVDGDGPYYDADGALPDERAKLELDLTTGTPVLILIGAAS